MERRTNRVAKAAIIFLAFVCTVAVIYRLSLSTKAYPNPAADGTESITAADMDYQSVSLSEVVQASNLIVKASYTGPVECKTHLDHSFSVSEVLYGDYSDPTINVCEYDELPIEYQYEPGQEYLLVLERSVSVYFEHDRFYPVADVFVPLNSNEPVFMAGQALGSEGEALAKDPEGQLKKMITRRGGLDAYWGTEYVTSNEVSEIAASASHILKVEIGNVLHENESLGTTSFECKVKEIYSGTNTDEDVFINFFDGTVESGKDYVVLVNQVEPDSLVYSLAAKDNSVFPADAENISMIMDELN